MKLAAFLLVGVLACDAKDEASPTAPTAPSADARAPVDPVLVESLCALSMTPPGSGTGSAAAGVLTNGKTRRPWIARSYDARFASLEAIERGLFLLKDRTPSQLEGMYPTMFCNASGPVYISLVVSGVAHDGAEGTWLLAGDITTYERKFVPGQLPRSTVMMHAVAPVVAAMGEGTKLEQLPIRTDMKSTGVSGEWAQAFERQRAR